MKKESKKMPKWLIPVVIIGIIILAIVIYNYSPQKQTITEKGSIIEDKLCTSRSIGSSWRCDENGEYADDTEYWCECEEGYKIFIYSNKDIISPRGTCVRDNDCKFRSPGSEFRCNEQKNFSFDGNYNCGCTEDCEVYIKNQ